tara:strand:+ start:1110 stop:1379 length:270 start_codon:yes stop_codon:yes gene_type:complete
MNVSIKSKISFGFFIFGLIIIICAAICSTIFQIQCSKKIQDEYNTHTMNNNFHYTYGWCGVALITCWSILGIFGAGTIISGVFSFIQVG